VWWFNGPFEQTRQERVGNTYVSHAVVSKERLEEGPEHQETQKEFNLMVFFVVFFEFLFVCSQVVTHPTSFLFEQLANKHMSVSLQFVVKLFAAALATVHCCGGRHYWKAKEKSGVVLLLQSVGNDGREVTTKLSKNIVNHGAILPIDKEIFD